MAIKINPGLTRLSGGYGLTAAGLTMVAFLVFYYLHLQPWRNLLSLFLDVILMGVVSFMATKDFRDNENGGELRFYHGMTIGFIIYTVAALLFSLFYFFFITVITPDFMGMYRSSMVEFLESRKELIVANAGEASFQRQVVALSEVTDFGLSLDAFGKKIISGLFLAPVFSIVLRTHQH